jgi:hypothetical protein
MNLKTMNFVQYDFAIAEIRESVESDKANKRKGTKGIGDEIESEFKYSYFIPTMKRFANIDNPDCSRLGLMKMVLCLMLLIDSNMRND